MSFTRFIESYDSVRFVNLHDREERLIHAEIETMLALLFGERIILPEAQCFDSLGFLSVAAKVLDARPKGARADSPIVLPFQWALRPGRGYETFNDMAASYFEEPNGPFILSGWPEITSDSRARKDIAECFRSNDFKQAARIHDVVRDRLELLEYVSGNFQDFSPSRAKRPKYDLIDYVHRLKTTSPDRFPERWNQIPSIVQRLEEKGVSFTNRSAIRDSRLSSELDQNDLGFILEFVDSAYNHMIANSIAATGAVFSTRGDGDDIDNIRGKVMSEEISTQLGGSFAARGPMRLAMTTKLEEMNHLKEIVSSPEIWRRVWEIATSDKWITSISKLRAAMGRDEVFDCVEKHVELLAGKLGPLLLQSRDGRIVATIVGSMIAGSVGVLVEYVFDVPGTAALGTFFGAITGQLAEKEIVERGEDWTARGCLSQELRQAVYLERPSLYI